MASDSPDPKHGDLLEELLAQCLRQPLELQADAIEQACLEHPPLASALRDRFARIQSFGLQGMAAEVRSLPTRFDDFEVLEAFGDGSMGVVYLAEQKSLGRKVVLKTIREELLPFASSRERFQREAEAISRLRHPGIVPIHLIGEADGKPFFAMEYIEGFNLAERLMDLDGRAPESLTGADMHPMASEGETWVQACVGVAIQAALALHHAHGQGILHRDLKPSNLMYGADGRLRVIDFGLHLSGATPDPSRGSGHPGTLLYMPPEQLDGKKLDARSEVYALAATLHELLCLQPPFRGTDRAATEAQVRAGVLESMHARNRRIPADLELVVAKALSREPGRRYPDMRSFALDLKYAIERRPIQARPQGLGYRFRRWCARQPALAASLLLLGAGAVAAPTYLWLHQRAYSQDLRHMLAVETEARAEAEDLATLFLDVLDQADPNLSDGQQTAREVLQSGLEAVQQELVDRPYRLAQISSAIGRIQGNLGMFQESVGNLQKSLRWFEEHREALVAQLEIDDSPLLQTRIEGLDIHYSDAYWTFVDLLARHEMAAPAAQVLEAAWPVWERTYGAGHWRMLTARANQLRYAREQVDPNDPEAIAAAPTTEEILTAMREAVAATLASADAQEEHRGASQGWLGAYLLKVGMGLPQEEKRAVFEEARGWMHASLEAIRAAGHADTMDHAIACNSFALALKFLGEHAEAEALYHEVKEVLRLRLGEDHPNLGVMLINIGALQKDQEKYAEAIVSYTEAMAVLDRAENARPSDRLTVRSSLYNLRFQHGAQEGLLEPYLEALPEFVEGYGQDHLFTAQARLNIGRLLLAADRVGEARAQLQEALRVMRADPACPPSTLATAEGVWAGLEAD